MKVGDIVIFTGTSNAWEFDDTACSRYGLIVGKEYVVSKVSHGDYSCHILLEGKDAIWFATAFFKEKECTS